MPYIIVKIPGADEARHELTGEVITLGRLPDNTIQITDDSVSRYHAQILLRSNHYRLKDLGSANQSFINGSPVAEAVLGDGDRVRFGFIECEFHVGQLPAAAGSPAAAPGKPAKVEAVPQAEPDQLVDDATPEVVEQLQGKITELREQLKNVQKEKEDFSSRMEALERLNELTIREAEQKAKLATVVAVTVEAERDLVKKQITELSARLSSTDAKILGLEAAKAAAEKAGLESETKAESVRNQLAAAGADRDAARAALGTAEKRLKELTQRTEALDGEKKALAARIEKLQPQLTAAAAERDAAKAEIAAAKAQVAEVQQALAKTAGATTAAEREKAAAEKRFASLTAGVAQTREQLEQTRLMAKEAAAAQKKLNDQVAALTRNKEQLSAKLGALQPQLQTASSERDAAREEAAKATAALAAAQKELAAASRARAEAAGETVPEPTAQVERPGVGKTALSPMQRTRIPLLIVLVLLGLFLMRESRQAPADFIDVVFGDWLAANTEVIGADAPLAVVEIGPMEETAGNGEAEWPAMNYALFLQALLPLEPSVVGIAPALEWHRGERDAPQHLRILHEFVLKTPRLVLGAQLGFPEDPDVIPAVEVVPVIRNVEGDLSQVAEYTLVERQAQEDLRLSPEVGFTNVASAPHRERKVPLIFRYRGQVVPSFALQMAALWAQVTPDEIRVRGSEIKIGDSMTVPIDAQGCVALNPGARFARLAHEDLLLAIEQRAAGKPPIVPLADITGRAAILTRGEGSAGWLHARALATIQLGRYAKRVAWWVEPLVIVLMLAFALYVLRIGRFAAVLAAIALMSLYLLLCLTLYGLGNFVMPLLLPLGMLLVILFYRCVIPDAARPARRANVAP